LYVRSVSATSSAENLDRMKSICPITTVPKARRQSIPWSFRMRGRSSPEATILVRGGPDTVAKLAAHTERVRRAFVLDSAPVLGISVFAALADIGPASWRSDVPCDHPG
jgi:hypothetical protein